MKRIFAVLLIVGLLGIAGCGEKENATKTEPTADTAAATTAATTQSTTEPIQTTEPEIASLTTQNVRQQLTDQGKRFAVAYLGFLTFESETVWSFLDENAAILEDLEFIKEIPETNICGYSSMGEVYCIIPAEAEATIKVYGGSSTGDDEPVYEELLYEGTGAEPYLLVCNASFNPDTMVELEFSDETTYRWYPKMDDYYFVEGLWGGEMSDSEDGYDTLDLSPYSKILLGYYQALLDEEGSTWEVPTEADLLGLSWVDEGYTYEGEHYMYRMTIGEGGLTASWEQYGEVNEYTDAPWSYAVKNGMAVLTVDFAEFAGVKSYNLLLDREMEMLYVAMDISSGEIQNLWERQYRYLLKDSQSQPDDLVGTWQRTATEVEGDRQISEPGACTVQITGSEDSRLVISYTETDRPAWSYSDVDLLVMPSEDGGFVEQCTWKATVDNTLFETNRDIYLMPDGTLVIRNTFYVDGAPMVSYEFFERI